MSKSETSFIDIAPSEVLRQASKDLLWSTEQIDLTIKSLTHDVAETDEHVSEAIRSLRRVQAAVRKVKADN